MKLRLTKDEFLERAKSVHGDWYDYSEVVYDTVKKKVKIICRKHGPFMQAPEQHMLGQGCRECAKEKRKATMLERHGVEYPSQLAEMQAKSRETRMGKFGGMKPPGSGRKAMTKEEFVWRAREVHGNRYDYSQVEYAGSGVKVRIGCPVHGIFEQTPARHLQGRGCSHPECIAARKASTMGRKELGGARCRVTLEEFLRRAREKHGDRYDYSHVEYRNTKTKVEIVCPEHGPFLQSPEKHMAGAGCPHAACVVKRMKATNQAKYGVDYPLQSDVIKRKAMETCQERYGTDNIMQSDVGKARMAEACMEKHGATSPLGSKEVRDKIMATNAERYGGGSPMCSIEVQAKAKAAIQEKYGVDNPMKSDAIKAKVHATCEERFGSASPLSNEAIQAKKLATMRARYGGDSPFCDPSKVEMAQATSMERYGVRNAMQLDATQAKVVETKSRNGTFNASAPEDVMHGMLCERFGTDDVVRQYMSDVYPHACDFYVKSRALYIELNGTWTHGRMWYRGTEADVAVVEEWQSKSDGNRYYAAAVETWTKSDVAKREDAKRAKLNFVALWDDKMRDADLWFAMGCPDGRDWEREYSWIPERHMQGIPMPKYETMNAGILSRIMKHYQFDAFYAKEIALWERNGTYRNLPLQVFLYANRLKYVGKLPDELTDSRIMQAFTISGVMKGYTRFDTTAMDAVVARYGIESIHDPCAGWGERMLYCHFHGIPYVGVDVNGALRPGYEAMMSELGMEGMEFHVADSATYAWQRTADAVVTCPPYGGTEIYSPDGAENLDEDAFLDWWKRTVENVAGTGIRLFCFQANRKWRGRMAEIVEQAGFRMIDEVACPHRSSHMTKKGGVDRKTEDEAMVILEHIRVVEEG